MKKIPVYMMPGLAANPKIFDFLKLPDNYQAYYMNWILPVKNESIQNYAKRLVLEQIDHENPIVLGVSFGGIMAIEISKIISVKKLILISTIKNHNEFSPFMNKVFRYKLYKFFPSRAMAYVDILEKISFTKNLKKKMKLYKIYMDVNEKQYLDWSIKTLLSWQQPNNPATDFVHINGTSDKVFPVRYIQHPFTSVKNGRHDMIIFRANWFNERWRELLT